MKLFKQNNLNKNSLKLRIVVLMLIALLSNYFLILTEFTGAVFATTNDLSSFINVDDKEQENTESEEIENIQEKEENEPSDEISEDIKETDVEDEEVVEEIEENSEIMDSSMEVLQSYSTSTGIVVESKVTTNISNVKNNLELQKVTLEAPIVEGYTVKEVYLNNVELNNDNLSFTSSVENNNIIIEITEIEESVLSQFMAYENNADDKTVILNNVAKEYTVLYVLEGTVDVNKFSIGIIEELNYSDDTSKQLSAKVEEVISKTERIENEYTVSSQNSSIYKGNLYANAISTLGYETNYSSIDNVSINSLENIDNILITEKADIIRTKTDEEIGLLTYTTYNRTSILIEEFDSIFGKDGYINILSNGNALGRIDINSKIDDDCYVFEYPEHVSNVEFSFNNMVNTGNLTILNTKTILPRIAFNRIEIINFKSIETEIVTQEFATEGENAILISETSNVLKINLEDTESKVDFDMSTEDLITTQLNTVTMNVTLKTNEEKYELFQNPVIDIELPSAVEKVDIKNINLMYKNGLSISNWEILETETNSKVIRIRLDGIQNEYKSDGTIGGTTVIINADLGLNRITANGKGTIKVRYTNDAGTNISYLKEGKDSDNYEVNYVSKSGILKEVRIENFDDENTVLKGYEDQTIIAEIEAESKTISPKISSIFMNNYNVDISNVQILGKIPFIGNTKDNIDLNTTFDTKLSGPISLNGLVAKVYYSTEENPDLENGEWLENVENFENIKTFKIAVENENMKPGEKIELSYNINIPENVGYNAQAYNLITAYYNLNEEQIKDASIVGLKTEERAIELDDCQVVEQTDKLAIGTKVTEAGILVEDGEVINERQILKYTVVVENTSKEEIRNLKIRGKAENTNSYYWYTYEVNSSTDGSIVTTGEMKEDVDNEFPYQEKVVESLLPGESIVYSYEVKVKSFNDIASENVQGKVLISANGIEEKEYLTIKNPVTRAAVELSLRTYGLEDVTNMYIGSNDEWIFSIDVKNITGKTLENVEVNLMLPSLVKFNEWSEKYNTDDISFETKEISTGTMVTFTIDKLEANETKNLNAFTNVGKIPLDTKLTNITLVANSEINGIVHYSNEYTREVLQSETYIKFKYSSNVENESKVSHGDEITYTLEFENAGYIGQDIYLIDYFPYGLTFKSAQAYLPNGTIEELEIKNETTISCMQLIEAGEKLKVDINFVVDENTLRTNQTEIINEIEVLPQYNIDEVDTIIFYIDNNQGSIYEEDEDLYIGEEEREAEKNEEETLPKDEEEDVPSIDNTTTEDEGNLNHSNFNETDTNTTEKPKEETPKEEKPKEEKPKEETPKEEKPKEEKPKEDDKVISVNSAKYSISGKVWLDENKDGLNNSENIIPSVEVMLFKVDNSDIASINDSKLLKKITTDKNGEYRFNSLEKGKYVVAVNYDNTKYDLTTYQVDGKRSIKSSSVITKELNLNNTTKKYGVSDILVIEDTSIANVNAGLVENTDYDMKIDTYVSKVTVTTEKGIETKEFSVDDKLAKVEIASKYIDGAKVKVELKVRVTNNGKQAGYINQILSDIPEGFEIDRATSSSWQIGNDGNLYNSSLNKTKLYSNETKEFTIVLTKVMTGEDTGTYKNISKITDSTNDLQLVDSDKTNDESKVELLISIKTGAMYYVLIAIILIGIAAVIVIFINKFIKDNSRRTIIIKIVISILIIIFTILIIKNEAAEMQSAQANRNANNMIVDYTFTDLKDSNGNYTTFDPGFKEVANKVNGEKVYNSYSAKKIVAAPLAQYLRLDDMPIGYVFRELGDADIKLDITQCIHGGNVAGGGTQETWWELLTNLKIIGNDYTTQYEGLGNTVKNKAGTSTLAGELAYFADYVEDEIVSLNGVNKDYKQDNVYADNILLGYLYYYEGNDKLSQNNQYKDQFGNIEELLGINVVGAGRTLENELNLELNNGTFMNILSDAKTYSKNLSNVKITKKDSTTKLEYNSTYDAYGPIYVTMPTGAKLQMSTDNGNKFEDMNITTVKTAAGNKSISDCNNLAFYIPSSYFESIDDFTKVRIRIYAESDVKIARLNGWFFELGYGGQDQILMRGCENTQPSYVDYQVDGKKYIASINKYVATIDGVGYEREKDKTAKIYADKGSEVLFRINVTNTGKNTTLKNISIIDDEVAGLEFIGYRDVKLEGANAVYSTTTSGANWSKSGNKYTYSASLTQGQTASIYVKYKVTKDITNVNNALTNKVYISALYDDTNTKKYERTSYTGNATLNNMDNGGVYTSEDTLYTNTYDLSITKVASAEVFEVGDKVTYTIKVTNKASTDSIHYGNIKDIVVEDIIPDGLTNVSYSGTNWTQNGNNYVYNGTLATGGSTSSLIIMATIGDTLISNSPQTITNTATVTTAKNKNSENIHSSSNNVLPKTAQVSIKVKGYNLSIEKEIYSIVDVNNNVVTTERASDGIVKSAEIGDVITYKITLKNNNGTQSADYGSIKYKIEETLPEGFEYITSSGWTEQNGKYYYTQNIASGGAHTLEIKMRVSESMKSSLRGTFLDKENIVRVVDATNKNNISVLTEQIVAPIEASEIVRVKGYNISLEKSVVAVKNPDGTDTGDTTVAEIDDIVTFEIVIKNTGTNSTDFGDLTNIAITDIFDNGQFELCAEQNYGTGWSVNGNVYSYNGILAPQESTTLTISMKVILETNAKQKIYNVAKLSSLKNRNNINLLDIFNLEDDAEVEVQTYDIGLNKYIIGRNYVDVENGELIKLPITDRNILTNIDKNNSPVEVEQNDTVIYTLEMANKGTTTLNNFTLVDTLESGLEFMSTVNMRRVDADGNSTTLTSSEITETINNNVITYNYPGELNGGETIYIDIEVLINKTNMYLLNLKNKVELIQIYNKNDYELISTGLLNFIENEFEEYVRLKNLKIEGTVWLDVDEDGYIDEGEEKLKDIQVILHDDTNNKVASTKTDENGHYKFTETNGITTSGAEGTSLMVEGGDNSGRVIKGTNRDDETGNYSPDSKYIKYYIEFSYNGVTYTSSTYHGRDHMEGDNTISDEYKIDSNAKEYEDLRTQFNNNLSIIAFNKGINGYTHEKTSLKFTKNEHTSKLKDEEGALTSAYSFALSNTNYGTKLVHGSNIEMLFLGASATSAEGVNTEYLKYINLGLVEREKVDLEITKDLMYTQVSIKGNKLDYEYEKVEEEAAAQVPAQKALYYRKDFEHNKENAYELYLYKSDYYYRYDMYENAAVRNHWGTDSELELDLVYKITVTNASEDDVFVEVLEIIDQYSSSMEIRGNAVYMVKTDAAGNKEKRPVTVAYDYSIYNNANDYMFDGYKQVILTGMEQGGLEKGGKFEIYLSYYVEKYNKLNEAGEVEIRDLLYMDNKYNVAQISAYSTYEKDESGVLKPIGLVDVDSNVGNINKTEDGIGIDQIELYDDTAFRIILDMEFKDGTEPGDPPVTPDPTPDPEPDYPEDPDPTPDPTPDVPDPDDSGEHTERYVSGYVFEDIRSELIEKITNSSGIETNINQLIGDGKYDPSVSRHNYLNYNDSGYTGPFSTQMKRLKNTANEELQDIRNDKKLEGMTVEIVEIMEIDGEIYEETLDYSEVEPYIEESFAKVRVQTNASGTYYVESFTPGNYIVRFRYGDVYVDGSISANSLIHNGQDYKSTIYNVTDEFGNTIESTADNNTKVNALKEEGKSDARDNEYRRLQIMAETENMINSTAEFVKATNYLNNDGTVKISYTEDDGTVIDMTDKIKEFSKATAAFADTIVVGFGLEDAMFVKDISLSTMFVPIGVIEEPFERALGGYVEFEKQGGLKYELPNVDFGVSYRPENFIELTNKIQSIKIETSAGNVLVDIEYEYDEHYNANLVKTVGVKNMQAIDTLGKIQGFRYINVDEELLQGAKVTIKYILFVDNIGEVETFNYKLMENNVWGPSDMLSQLDSSVLESTLTDKDGNTIGKAVNYSRMDKLIKAKYGASSNYEYGTFVGAIYYKGSNISEVEATSLRIVPIKVKRLINWVDNDATFEVANNATVDKYWTATTEKELTDNELIDLSELFTDETGAYYRDENGRKYTTENRKNIALSVNSEEQNLSLIKNIYPKIANNGEETSGFITLETNAILAAGNDNEDMSYDNVAEIAEFETILGRRTNFASTVGNIHLTENGGTPFSAALNEVDTAGTEIVHLTPPTGLTRFRLFMAYNIRIMTTIMIIVIIAILALLTKKYIIGRKKFYK